MIDKYDIEIQNQRDTNYEIENELYKTKKGSEDYNKLLKNLEVNVAKYYLLVASRNTKREIEAILEIHSKSAQIDVI